MKSLAIKPAQDKASNDKTNTLKIRTDLPYEWIYKRVKNTLKEKGHFFVQEESNTGFIKTNPGLIGVYLGVDLEFYISQTTSTGTVVEVRYSSSRTR